MQRTRIRYVGHVQGVGFRATAAHIARGHAVTGWVRNEPDGSVLLEVQGEPAVITDFLRELADRMSGRITKADVALMTGFEPDETGFSIRR